MTPEQCEAGRRLLGWTRDELAAASEVAKSTIQRFERRQPTPVIKHRTIEALRDAMAAKGVVFVSNPTADGSPTTCREIMFADGTGVRLETPV